jgi:nitroreductase
MKKTAVTAAPLAELIAERWSPRAFDAAHQASDAEILAVLEAGRWAPSANNGQPWRFSVARRGSGLFNAMVGATTGFNQAWLPNASFLVLVSAVKLNAEGNPHRTFMFDCGLAVQNMLLQAEASGLAGHVVGGMDREAMPFAAGVPDDLQVVMLVAIGKPTDASVLPEGAREREVLERSRLSLDDIVIVGKP